MLFPLFFVLLFPSALLAATPMDFAGGFVLETEPGFALQRLELPLEVYNAGARSDMGDLRVFNAAGEEMPMHLRRQVPQAAAAVPLPMFRLDDEVPDRDIRLRVRTSDRGAVVETEVRARAGVKRVLLDAAGAPASLGGLRFVLGNAPGLVRVSVSGSDDLAAWTRAGEGVLARIERPDGVVLQDHVRLTGRPWRYYLVMGADLSTLAAATGLPAGGQISRSFTPVEGTVVSQGLYEYALPPGLPADMVDLGEVGDAVLRVAVQVPQGEGWGIVAAGTLFRLHVDGRILSGPGLPVPGPMGRFRVAMQGAVQPLRVGWIPHELVFMTQGSGPYTLALGNPAVQAGAELLAPMLRQGDMAPMGRAVLGAGVRLGGEERMRPARSYTKVVLWMVLGVGVALLGAMAWRLARDMGVKAGRESGTD